MPTQITYVCDWEMSFLTLQPNFSSFFQLFQWNDAHWSECHTWVRKHPYHPALRGDKDRKIETKRNAACHTQLFDIWGPLKHDILAIKRGKKMAFTISPATAQSRPVGPNIYLLSLRQWANQLLHLHLYPFWARCSWTEQFPKKLSSLYYCLLLIIQSHVTTMTRTQ